MANEGARIVRGVHVNGTSQPGDETFTEEEAIVGDSRPCRAIAGGLRICMKLEKLYTINGYKISTKTMTTNLFFVCMRCDPIMDCTDVGDGDGKQVKPNPFNEVAAALVEIGEIGTVTELASINCLDIGNVKCFASTIDRGVGLTTN